jgi:hypothetical protein
MEGRGGGKAQGVADPPKKHCQITETFVKADHLKSDDGLKQILNYA